MLGTYLAKLTPSKYLGPHKVSAFRSSCILTAGVSGQATSDIFVTSFTLVHKELERA